MINESLLYRQDDQPFASVKGNWLHRELLAGDFKPSGKPFNANTPSVVASYPVPRNNHMVVKPRAAFGMYLYVLAVTTMSGALAAGDFTLTLAGLLKSTQRVPDTFPAAATTSHPDVVVFNNLNQPVQVKSVNYLTGEVVVARTAGVTSLRAYYISGNGEVIARAKRPSGSDGANQYLWRSSFRSLHETDQLNDDTAPTFGQLFELAAQFDLELVVTAPLEVKFDAYAPHKLRLPVAFVPVQIVPGQESRYHAKTEVSLRGGRI
jgi:hypothetical protein